MVLIYIILICKTKVAKEQPMVCKATHDTCHIFFHKGYPKSQVSKQVITQSQDKAY